MKRTVSYILAAVLLLTLTSVGSAFFFKKRPIPPEYHALLTDWYGKYLGRPLDEQGFEVWGRRMLRGDSPREVEAAILGSREYFHRQGGNNVSFVRGLYRDVMGTDPGEAQMAYWLHKLSDLEYRDDFAENFLKTARKNSAFGPPPSVPQPSPFPAGPPSPPVVEVRPSYGPGSYNLPPQGSAPPPQAQPSSQFPQFIPSSGGPSLVPEQRLVPTPLPQLPPPQYQPAPQCQPLPLPRG